MSDPNLVQTHSDLRHQIDLMQCELTKLTKSLKEAKKDLDATKPEVETIREFKIVLKWLKWLMYFLGLVGGVIALINQYNLL